MFNCCNIIWHKLTDKAIIPTKRLEDAGFDIYTTEDFVFLGPHQQHLFQTGLQVALDFNYWLAIWDRGSTGSKGIHVHCGVVDQGYRDELFICLKNDNDYPIIFTAATDKIYFEDTAVVEDKVYPKVMYYPVSKAIAQAIPILQPIVTSQEVDTVTWNDKFAHNSERGTGKLGSSGK